MFALPGTVPSKPGLVRDRGFSGAGIDIELFAVPEHQFGGFVAAVPPPLTIGTVIVEDGVAVKGFLCESAALADSEEITHFGGWTSFLRSQCAVGP